MCMNVSPSPPMVAPERVRVGVEAVVGGEDQPAMRHRVVADEVADERARDAADERAEEGAEDRPDHRNGAEQAAPIMPPTEEPTCWPIAPSA